MILSFSDANGTATVDRRLLVAVGCEEGVWIGLRHDPRSLRKVLHVKAVTNIAVLEEFGIFLVLQDKVSVDHPEARHTTHRAESSCVSPRSIGTLGSVAAGPRRASAS